jgi:hypothetical protein
VSVRPDPFLDYDAAYVIGALDPPDRRAYEKHLIGCARCTTAVSELAGMPGLLAQVPTEQMLAPRPVPEAPPDTLLPRLAAAIRRQRRRRQVLGGLVGVAAAAVLATGAVLTAGSLSSPDGSMSGKTLVMSAVVTSPVTASVHLDPVAWGTRLDLDCSYREPETDKEKGWGERTYRLVVVPRDGGAVQQVAQWKAEPGQRVVLPGSTNLAMDEMQDIRLLNSSGATLLHVVPTA